MQMPQMVGVPSRSGLNENSTQIVQRRISPAASLAVFLSANGSSICNNSHRNHRTIPPRRTSPVAPMGQHYTSDAAPTLTPEEFSGTLNGVNGNPSDGVQPTIFRRRISPAAPMGEHHTSDIAPTLPPEEFSEALDSARPADFEPLEMRHQSMRVASGTHARPLSSCGIGKNAAGDPLQVMHTPKPALLELDAAGKLPDHLQFLGNGIEGVKNQISALKSREKAVFRSDKLTFLNIAESTLLRLSRCVKYATVVNSWGTTRTSPEMRSAIANAIAAPLIEAYKIAASTAISADDAAAIERICVTYSEFLSAAPSQQTLEKANEMRSFAKKSSYSIEIISKKILEMCEFCSKNVDGKCDLENILREQAAVGVFEKLFFAKCIEYDNQTKCFHGSIHRISCACDIQTLGMILAKYSTTLGSNVPTLCNDWRIMQWA
jgi:hypothetical protein